MQRIDAQNYRRRFIIAFSIAMIAIPIIGGAVEIFLGVYSLREIMGGIVNYAIFYITGVYIFGVYILRRKLISYTDRIEQALQSNDQKTCIKLAKRFSKLNLFSLGFILLYSQGGPFSVNYFITSQSLRSFSIQQQILSYITTLPTILIILFPFFFYLYDLLAKYLAPRGVVINTLPIRIKTMVLGIVTPLLVDVVLILYFEDRTGYFNIETVALWVGLFSISAAGAHLTYRSFARSLQPLQGPLSNNNIESLSSSDITPLSLDEIGLLAHGWKNLLHKNQQHQQALQSERNFSHTIINNANVIVVVLDDQGRIIEFNKVCEEVTLFKKSEVLGDYVWDHFIIPEEVEGVKNVFRDLTQSSLNNKYTNYWLNKKGERRLIAWSNSTIEDATGKVQNIIAVGTDITDQRQAEEDLRTSQDTLAKAQAIAHIGHWDWNVSTNRLVWSDEAYRIFGLTPQIFEATYPAFLEYVHPDDRDAVANAVSASANDPSLPYSIEHRVCRPDGTMRIVHERGEVYRDPQGRALRMVGTVHDITERKQSEQAIRALNADLELRVKERTIELEQAIISLQHSFDNLQRTQKQLVESEKMAALGGLVAGIAHEINTPIGIGVTAASHLSMKIREYQKLYENDQLTRQDFETLLKSANDSSNILQTNLQRAAEMIRGFKMVAVDQSSEQSRKFDLNQYLRDVLRSLHPRLHQGDYAVHIDCQDPLIINSYPGAISQIITNLVINSLIHGFEAVPKGQIWINVNRTDHTIHIEYSDDGKGIDENSLNRIFDPFYTTKRSQGGSGLGLHILYNIVTQTLSGTVSVESKPDHGVKFRISFPELGD